jgi:sugar lactone lactonase YvrE
VLLLSMLATAAQAASWDPDLRWKTLHTDHFEVSFHDGEEALAVDVADAAEEAWDLLTVELAHEPKGKVQIVMVDWTDSANGMAQALPYNQITLYVTSPGGDSTLGLYEDWNDGLVIHELTHILQMDTVEGLPRLARALFGTLISTHQVAPLWTVEGLATFQETRQTTGGRGRSASVDMLKRAVVLEGAFPPLGNLDGFQPTSPGGNLRYLFGQDFMQFIADSRGDEKWTEWVHRYGSSVPFFLQARRTFGASFVELHKEWKAALELRYAAQKAAVEAQGATSLTRLSPEGQACGAPSYNPVTGELWYSCQDLRRGSGLWKQAPGGAPKLVERGRFADDISWRNDGEAFLYSETHTQGLYNVVDDVFVYEVDKKSATALTSGKRARSPTFSPDGGRVVCVTNELQVNRLAELTIDQRLLPLTDVAPRQFGAPTFSPDGRLLAVSAWEKGTRDLWLYLPDGTPWRRLTWDAAIDSQPAFSADGAWLYFTSDRTGIPNIYAVEMATDRLFQVTNDVIGAYAPSPSPDGTALAVLTWSASGARVASLPLAPSAWRALGVLPTFEPGAPALAAAPAYAPRVRVGTPELPIAGRVARAEREARAEAREARRTEREARADARREAREKPSTSAESPAAETAARAADPAPAPVADTAPDPAADPRIRPYTPLPTLFPPRFWIPGTLLTTTGEDYGLYLSAYSGGADALRQYSYSGFATWRTDAQFLGGGGSFTLNKWRPVFQLSASTYVSPYSTVSTYTPVPEGGGASIPGIQSTDQRYWDHRIRAGLSMWYPLTTRSGLSAGIRTESRAPKDALPGDVYFATLPSRGLFQSLTLGWSYARGEGYALSISPEKARSLGVGIEYTPAWLGSFAYDTDNQPAAFDQVQLTGEWREYVTAPWAPNHVIAWKASGGLSMGSTFRYGSFRLGGTFSENGVTVIPAEWRALRGYSPSTRDGEAYWLASGEYRFPLWQIQRGVGTIPLYLRHLSGAVVVDAGNAWDEPEDATLDRSLLGVGAELRISGVAFYGLNLYGRLGYAIGLTGEGIAPGSLEGLYFAAGSSF